MDKCDIFVKGYILQMDECSLIFDFDDGVQELCNVVKIIGLKVGHFTVFMYSRG